MLTGVAQGLDLPAIVIPHQMLALNDACGLEFAPCSADSQTRRDSSVDAGSVGGRISITFGECQRMAALEGQPTKGNKEDLSKLRITKEAFFSDFGSSFSSRERGGSANPDLLAC